MLEVFFLILSCTGACVGSMLVVVIVWLIVHFAVFVVVPVDARFLLLASSCLVVRINRASFAPVFNNQTLSGDGSAASEHPGGHQRPLPPKVPESTLVCHSINVYAESGTE